jgi:hypothetical protein
VQVDTGSDLHNPLNSITTICEPIVESVPTICGNLVEGFLCITFELFANHRDEIWGVGA